MMSLRRMALRRQAMGGDAPADATYIVQQPDARLPNAQAVSSLGTGLLKAIAAGVLALAIAGTDYVASAGVAGGQTITGGTGGSETLTLRSTANATKGTIVIGTTSAVTVTDGASPQITIGNGAALISRILTVYGVGSNTVAEFRCSSGLIINNAAAELNIAGTNGAKFGTTTVAAVVVTNGGELKVGTGVNTDVVWGANNVEVGRLKASGDWVVGNGNTAATVLATNATAGFLRLPTCAGTPTGAAVDGSFVLDTTAFKLWTRIGGAWKQSVAQT